MPVSFDLYWSMRSPYCYLALDRIVAMRRDYNLEINVRPVFPLAIRQPDFFKRVNHLYRSYHTRDSRRIAEFFDIPFRRPVPDPIVQDMETHAIAERQPYIHRLTRLSQAAALAGRGLEFLDQVARMLWDGTVDNWDEGEHLAEAVARADLDLEILAAQIAAEPERLDAVIEQNQRDHEAAGHWGVPTMVFEGEPFYGQDRLEFLLWRMRRRGLATRA